MYALCWVQLKQICHWDRSNLDHILVYGDCLYISLGILDMLSAHELPGFLKLFIHNIPVWYVRSETQFVTLTFGDSFFKRCF